MSNESAGSGKELNFAQASPPRLLFGLLHKRFTGTLDVEQPGSPGQPASSRRIWFSGGMPVFSNWASGPDVLGQVLLETRRIDDATLMAGLQQMASTGGLLGEVLVQQGVLDQQQLAEALRLQCARKLMHVFALREGPARLRARAHDLSGMLAVNVLELLLAAVGRHYDQGRVRDEMGPHLDATLRASAAYERYRDHFRFRPTDAPMLAALQAGTSFTALSGAGEGGSRRAAQLTYVLWATQMLYTGNAAQQAAAAPSRPTQRAAPKPAPAVPKPAAPKSAPPPEPEPGPRSAQEDDDEEKAYVAELETFEARMAQDANPFALLGLELSAGRRDLRHVWSDLSRRMHPDALQAKGWDHLRERVTDVFAALSEANSTLSNKEDRERLAHALERGDDVSASADAEAANLARAAFESEIIARDADRYLRANKFERALAEYERALELTPDEPDYQAAATWCRYNLSDRSRGEAQRTEKTLGVILTDSPRLARAQMWRGHVLREMGASGPAIICYERALEADARLIDAERFMRALKVSRGENPNGKGKGKGKGKAAPKKSRGLRGFFSKG